MNKALIKDLELQIDYLVGYAPQGNHWKVEYHLRQTIIDEVLANEQTPPEIREKINRLLQSLYDLRQGKKNKQEYLKHVKKPTHQARVKDMDGKIYYIEL